MFIMIKSDVRFTYDVPRKKKKKKKKKKNDPTRPDSASMEKSGVSGPSPGPNLHLEAGNGKRKKTHVTHWLRSLFYIFEMI